MPRQVDLKAELLQLSHDPTSQLTPDAGLQKVVGGLANIIGQIPEMLRAEILRVIETLLGIAANPIGALQDWARDIPLLSTLVFALTGSGGGLDQLSTHFSQFRGALQGIDLSGPPGAVLRAILEAGAQFVRNIMPSWIPQVSLHSIGRDSPNLVIEGDFQSSVTIDGGGFHWDGTDGRTKVGCAAVFCDGEDHVVESNRIPVSEGQELDLGAYVTHAGVTGAESIRVELNTYLGEDPVSTELVGAITPTFYDSTDWNVSISGEYTVPAGVDNVTLQLHVTSGATAGVAKFDDCWVKKTQLLQIPFIGGLPGHIDNFTTRIRDIIDAMFNGFNNVGEWLEENNPLETIVEVVLGLLGMGRGNQTDVAKLAARILSLESAANTISLDFNGASANNPGPGFVVTSSGGGGGNMGLDGRGALVWKPSGAGNRTQFARFADGALTTSACHLQWYLNSTPQSYVFDDAFTYFCCRMNGFTDFLTVRSGYDSVRIQANVGGVRHNVGPSWSGHPKNGDKFDWLVGEAGETNLRHHVLLRNDQVILDFSETTSVHGPSHLHVGCGMETGNRLVFFQNIPAGVAVLTAAEVL